MEIADALAKIVDQNVRFAVHYGEVTASSGNVISVKISGSDTAITNIRYLDSYSPTVSDIVVLLVNKGNIFASGNLA